MHCAVGPSTANQSRFNFVFALHFVLNLFAGSFKHEKKYLGAVKERKRITHINCLFIWLDVCKSNRARIKWLALLFFHFCLTKTDLCILHCKCKQYNLYYSLFSFIHNFLSSSSSSEAVERPLPHCIIFFWLDFACFFFAAHQFFACFVYYLKFVVDINEYLLVFRWIFLLLFRPITHLSVLFIAILPIQCLFIFNRLFFVSLMLMAGDAVSMPIAFKLMIIVISFPSPFCEIFRVISQIFFIVLFEFSLKRISSYLFIFFIFLLCKTF